MINANGFSKGSRSKGSLKICENIRLTLHKKRRKRADLFTKPITQAMISMPFPFPACLLWKRLSPPAGGFFHIIGTPNKPWTTREATPQETITAMGLSFLILINRNATRHRMIPVQSKCAAEMLFPAKATI